MGTSIVTTNTVTFLKLLNVANYIFLALYFASAAGIRYLFTTNRSCLLYTSDAADE